MAPKEKRKKPVQEKVVKRTSSRLKSRKPLSDLPLTTSDHESSYEPQASSDPFDVLRASPEKRPVKYKPLSFWQKKVKELEEVERQHKGKDLYDFSSPESSGLLKKRRQPKPRRRKENQTEWRITSTKSGSVSSAAALKILTATKGSSSSTSRKRDVRNPNEVGLIKERVLYNKAQKLGTAFTFEKPAIFGISSTPDKTKQINYVKPSYFDFDSPIHSVIPEVSGSSGDYSSTVTAKTPRMPVPFSAYVVESSDDERSKSPTLSKTLPSKVNGTGEIVENAQTPPPSINESNDGSSFVGFSGFSPCDLNTKTKETGGKETTLALSNNELNDRSSFVGFSGFSPSDVTVDKRSSRLSTAWETSRDELFRSPLGIKNVTIRRGNRSNSNTKSSDTQQSVNEHTADSSRLTRVLDDNSLRNITFRKRHKTRESVENDQSASPRLDKEHTSCDDSALEPPLNDGLLPNVTLRRRRFATASARSSADMLASPEHSQESPVANVLEITTANVSIGTGQKEVESENIEKDSGFNLADSEMFQINQAKDCVVVDPLPMLMQKKAESKRETAATRNISMKRKSVSDSDSSPPKRALPSSPDEGLSSDEYSPYFPSTTPKAILETSESEDIMATDHDDSTLMQPTQAAKGLSVSSTKSTHAELSAAEDEEGDELRCLPNMEETGFFLNNTNFLPTGKQCHRARDLLRNLQHGTLNASIVPVSKGRRYESFVESIVEMQQVNQTLEGARVTRSKSRQTCVANKTVNRITFGLGNQSIAAKLQRPKQARKSRLTLHRLANNTVNRTSLGLRSDESTLNTTCFANKTLRVVAAEDHEQTVFRAAYGIGDETLTPAQQQVTARNAVLLRCGQTEPLQFDEFFNQKTLPNCKKIGEGVYGEVFMYSSLSGRSVLKIIPIEGDFMVNDSPQKTFEEILSEVVISMELSNLRYGKNNKCDGFAEVRRVWCVQGEYPDYLLDLWDQYNTSKGSENDNPTVFENGQLFIVLELAHAGQDLEAFVFKNAVQSAAAFKQTTFALAAAERAFQFEHRDLHWGNVLLSTTEEPTVTYRVDGENHTIRTEGVKVAIIDFTLSRMSFEGCSIYNDLSVDPELFTSQGDYQFDIYRHMKDELKDNWEVFCPRTNVFWLHYMVDKMLTMVRYSCPRSKAHVGSVTLLKRWKETLKSHCSGYALLSLINTSV